MAKTRIGINGFGRIGRCAFRQILDRDDMEVVGINDLADKGDLAYLLRNDSIHGRLPVPVTTDESNLVIGGRRIPFFSTKSPAEIPWRDLGVEIVIDSSGAMRKRQDAAAHLEGGARKVIISAPADDADLTLVLGVNEEAYDPASHHVVSLASCTTNCLAPVLKVLNDRFGVESAMFTTVHAYTASQSLMDKPTRKRRRGRAAALSIIPTTTGAATATERVLPELKGRIYGMAMRVPVPDGSITDLTAWLQRETTAEEVNAALKEASERKPMLSVLAYSDDELVSQDIVGDRRSSIVDALSTTVLNNRVAKVLAWYDNEWGYAARLVDAARLFAVRGA